MRVIAGLGNPGRRYVNTRHNLGFCVVDCVQSEMAPKDGRCSGNLDWKSGFNCLYCLGSLNGEDVALVKPQTFMNRSGEPLSEMMRYYKLPVEALIVVHDELDLEFGTLRFKQGGGDGGHNGIKSIVASVGSSDFPRLRVGIGRPKVPSSVPLGLDMQVAAAPNVSDWVLQNLSSDERRALPKVLDRCVESLNVFIKDGLSKAQNLFNTKC